MSISTAIAKVDNGPGAVLAKSSADLATTMPSHLVARTDAWIRVIQGALRRDEKLMEAAQNDVGQFMSVMFDAARQGLEPGTEEYYLVPRWNNKKKRTEVTGVRGYKGEIELMYRAGAVSSVHCEVVYANDRFEFVRGINDRPIHADYDGPGDRGPLKLAYAYAIMRDGRPSQVVICREPDIRRAMESSDSSDKDWSPWKKHTAAMWRKTAAHQLSNWVPTSAEDKRLQQLTPPALPAAASEPSRPDNGADYYDAAEDEGPIEGELVD